MSISYIVAIYWGHPGAKTVDGCTVHEIEAFVYDHCCGAVALVSSSLFVKLGLV